MIGRRAIALLWTLNPAFFEGSVSLTTLAGRLGLHKAVMSAVVSDCSKTFDIPNRGQSHGWNFGQHTPKLTTPKRTPEPAQVAAAMKHIKARINAWHGAAHR